MWCYYRLVSVAVGERGWEGDVGPGGVQAVWFEVCGGELVEVITFKFITMYNKGEIDQKI